MKSFLAITLVLVLAACNSFNKYEIHAYPDSGGDSTPVRVTGQIAQSALTDTATKSTSSGDDTSVGFGSGTNSAVTVQCPLYQLPTIPGMPALPYDELAAARGNQRKIDAVAQNYINALRNYAIDLKKNIVSSHEKYLRDCQLANQAKNNSSGQ